MVARFVGELEVSLLNEGRQIATIKPFAYVDPGEKIWRVPVGTSSDGASIPRFLWTAIGGPLDGPYRRPAVVHDYYCDCRLETSDRTHRMFYDALITAAVDNLTARLFYAGVCLAGPKWNLQAVKNSRLRRPREYRGGGSGTMNYGLVVSPSEFGIAVESGKKRPALLPMPKGLTEDVAIGFLESVRAEDMSVEQIMQRAREYRRQTE